MAETDLILAAKASATDPVLVDGQVGPISLTTDGRLRVAAKSTSLPVISGALNTLGNTLVADCTDASNVTIHLTNTGTAAMAAGVFTFEGSLDSTDGSNGNWFGLQAARTDSNTIENSRGVSTLNAATPSPYAWEISVNAIKWFRIKNVQTVTASSNALWTIVRGTYATDPIPAIQPHTVTGSGTFTVAGGVTATPVSGTSSSLVSTAATNATLVKGGGAGGNLFEISASNPTATPAYLKLYNKSTAPTVGTDVPMMTIPIPANSNVSLEFGPLGKRFTSGIALAITGAIAATDTTASVAGIQVSATYN
jgi:hypothetical protein